MNEILVENQSAKLDKMVNHVRHQYLQLIKGANSCDEVVQQRIDELNREIEHMLWITASKVRHSNDI
jgi:hypothetical protein